MTREQFDRFLEQWEKPDRNYEAIFLDKAARDRLWLLVRKAITDNADIIEDIGIYVKT